MGDVQASARDVDHRRAQDAGRHAIERRRLQFARLAEPRAPQYPSRRHIAGPCRVDRIHGALVGGGDNHRKIGAAMLTRRHADAIHIQGRCVQARRLAFDSVQPRRFPYQAERRRSTRSAASTRFRARRQPLRLRSLWKVGMSADVVAAAGFSACISLRATIVAASLMPERTPVSGTSSPAVQKIALSSSFLTWGSSSVSRYARR